MNAASSLSVKREAEQLFIGALRTLAVFFHWSDWNAQQSGGGVGQTVTVVESAWNPKCPSMTATSAHGDCAFRYVWRTIAAEHQRRARIALPGSQRKDF
jgi:hypothetical protein